MGVSADFTVRAYALTCHVEEEAAVGEGEAVVVEPEATLSYR